MLPNILTTEYLYAKISISKEGSFIKEKSMLRRWKLMFD